MLKILDCTLRDGGYYNKWQFSNKLIKDYVKKINDSKIEYIEIGFRFLKGSTLLGQCAYSDNTFLNQIKSNFCKICIMINGADLIKDNKFNQILYKKLFPKKLPNNIHMVRIACHLKELKILLPHLRYLRKNFKNIGINLMQISEISNKEILNVSKKLKKKEIKVFYIADSLGCLDTKKIIKIVKLIKSHWKGEIGFHAHDNMKKALSNCKTAIKVGVSWIDATISGMGRGPGNVKTEELIKSNKFFLKKYNYKPIFSLLKNYFLPLKKIYGWGTNEFYYLAAKNKIHPTYIQTLITDKKDNYEINEKIKILSKIDSKKFNPDYLRLKNVKIDKNINNFNANLEIENKEVLILGSGKSIIKNKNNIEKLIKKRNLYVICLNLKETINEKLVNIRVSSHPLRIYSDLNKFTRIKKIVVIPKSYYNQKFIKKKLSNYINFFPFEVSKDNQFILKKDLIKSPSNLSISFALGIANIGKAKKIFLAGFDGYENLEYRNIEFNEIIKAYNDARNSKKVFSITDTKLKI